MAGVVGASVFSGTYPGVNDRIAAATTFDGFAGRAFAHTVQRFYYSQDSSHNGIYPTAANINNTGAPGDLSKHGIRLVISFKSAQDSTGAYTASRFVTEKKNLIAALNVIKAANIKCDGISVWHEPNNGD